MNCSFDVTRISTPAILMEIYIFSFLLVQNYTLFPSLEQSIFTTSLQMTSLNGTVGIPVELTRTQAKLDCEIFTNIPKNQSEADYPSRCMSISTTIVRV